MGYLGMVFNLVFRVVIREGYFRVKLGEVVGRSREYGLEEKYLGRGNSRVEG